MSTQETSGAGPSHKVVETAVALAVIAFGAIVILGSIGAGITWGAEGPRAGFFPFYVGIAIVVSGAINLWNAVRQDVPDGLFAEWSQLYQVMLVVVPTTIYAVAMANNAAAISLLLCVIIAWSMQKLGRVGWPVIAIAAIGIPALLYTWIADLLPENLFGLYAASAIFIAWFMRALGKYRWPMVAAVSIGTPMLVYIVFETYFLVPLPKGRVDDRFADLLSPPFRWFADLIASLSRWVVRLGARG